MVKYLIEKLEKNLTVSRINTLNGEYHYNDRKVYINISDDMDMPKYKEYDEMEFVINVHEFNGLFNETKAVRVVINSFDYQFNLSDHFSNKPINKYNFSETKDMLEDIYRYLSKKNNIKIINQNTFTITQKAI